MSPKLLADPEDFRAKGIQIVSQFAGVKISVEKTSSAKQLKQVDFPVQKIPAYQGDDGVNFFDCNAISYYLASEKLKGLSPKDKAEVIQWTTWAEELNHSATQWLLPTLGLAEGTRPTVEKAKSESKRSLKQLDDYLKTRTFLVGERITLADINIASVLLPLYVKLMDAKERGAYTNVTRWLDTLINQPQFKSVLGDVKYCQTAPTFKEGAFKKEQPKKEKEEKPSKPPQQKKKEADDDDDDDLVPKEKEKDPWAALPKGNFDMDDFKRFFSNNPEDKSIPYFWEKFDKENFSIWYCEYKYPEELSLIFMSCNLMTGMFQRLEKMRKWAFGSLLLFGEDHKNTISGIWVWRGHDLAFKLSPDWQVDYESYDWKKLDPDAPETKKLVDEYFRWEGDFGGKKFNQGKIFK